MPDTLVVKPLRVEVASDGAWRVVREAILAGKLRPGERIMEVRFADQLKTSRGTLREALRRLEAEGLVRRVPNRGVFVAELSPQDVEEFHVVRAALEGMAMRLTCRNLNPERMKTLEEIVRQSCVACSQRDYQLLDSLALRFHGLVCEWSGNKRLLQMWKSLSAQMKVCANYLYSTKDKLPIEEAVLTHRDCLEALASGDPDQAERTMRRHVDLSRDGLLAVISRPRG